MMVKFLRTKRAYLFPALAVMSLAAGACSAGHELRVDKAPLMATSVGSAKLVSDNSDSACSKAVLSALEKAYGVQLGDEWELTVTLAVRPVEIGTLAITDQGNWNVPPRPIGARRGPALHVLSVLARHGQTHNERVATVSARGPLADTPDDILSALATMAAKVLVEGYTPQDD